MVSLRLLKPAITLPILLIAGCVSFLPLPLSPIPILTKAFPETVVGPGNVQRAYTIKGDTFAYPQIGLEVSRPGVTDWEFVPGNNAVTVRLRNNVAGTEPRPSVAVQLLPLPEGTDVEASKVSDLVNLQKGNAAVTTSLRFLHGTLSDAWTITQPDPGTGLVATVFRVYVTQPNLLVLLTASADRGTFMTLAPKLSQILESVKLPNLAAGATPVPPPGLAPGLAARVVGAVYKDPGVGASITKADDNWVYGLSGGNVAIRRGGVAQGFDPTPQLTLTLAQSDGLDIKKVKEADLASLKADKIVPTTKTRTVGGVVGEEWTFSQPDVLGKPGTGKRVYLQTGKTVALIECTTLTAYNTAVQADFDKMIDSLTLPVAADAAATGAATPKPDAAATGAATPKPDAAATKAASPKP
ncbi:MAG: hypothetical protein JWM80_923 [Cyanobacteria bacterium RYN_339]|nr:hypothetical protein [Cyanobacteria bacterium RYN_339]